MPTRTIEVKVEVEFDGAGCGENCYALKNISNKRMYCYNRCIRYDNFLESVGTDVDEGIVERCADCVKEFGE